uniref:BTR1-LO-3 protein n=1 Tax=Aegilops longissima subsp. longissima TaxID=296026 RepID=A0A7G8ZAV4_AEGLO|nr:BTR1-LO-3 protein [Aegilops longissima subsp. longissima]
MAQPPWKAMYQYVAIRAHDSCARVEENVAAARRELASPRVLDTRNAAGRYTLLHSAMTHVEHASGCLSGVIFSMGVAEQLALHGCGAVPSRPVAGIGDLRRDRGDHDEWLALSRLEAAREHAQDALPGVERAFTLLASVRFLLHSRSPDAAGRRQAIEEQLHAATDELQAVVGSVANMSALAFLATQPAIRNRIQ